MSLYGTDCTAFNTPSLKIGLKYLFKAMITVSLQFVG